jgi:drug/metabolite transporter (DMT)-like permease
MLIGQLAALGTSLCFSATSTFFTLAARVVSSVVVNRIRLLAAVVFLTLAHLLFRLPLPLNAGPFRLFWLGISGIIGLVLGDAFLFQAFVWIGPRLAMLMMSLAPVFAALMGWFFLDEQLAAGQVAGILVTISGIAWVVLGRDRRSTTIAIPPRQYLLGILFGLGAALGQSGGLVTARIGLAGDYPALSGTLIRMVSAALTLWIFTLIRGQARPTFERLRHNSRALKFILAGAFFGPTVGVTLSLYAVQRIPVGVASTLIALTPVFLLPIGYFVFHERFGWQAVAGTLLTMLGVGLLFLV